ncbi:unnamed protein product, partial [Discosporangium mesarthrocarpum]
MPPSPCYTLLFFLCCFPREQDHLKAEIEVFVASIFLRILESEHSAFDHKV